MWRHGPDGLRTTHFVLEPFGPQHNDADYRAWSNSIDHIRTTPGFRADQWGGDEWPYTMSLADNLTDLTQHAQEFADGEAFAYTVLHPVNGSVIGCVYVDPDEVAEARCRLWVRADCDHLDRELEHAVRSWLSGPDWKFSRVHFPGRD